MEDKLDSETALARIKILISNYYEEKGRSGHDSIDSHYKEEALIEDIDDILDDTALDTKRVVIEKLELDRLLKGGIKK